MNATRRRQEQDAEPPAPQVPPPMAAVGLHDQSFTLQAIMELQKSFAEVNTNLQGLKGSVDGLKSKVDDLVAWKHRIVGGAIVLGVVGACLGFALSKASEYVTLKTSAPTASNVVAPEPVPVLVRPVSPAQAASK